MSESSLLSLPPFGGRDARAVADTQVNGAEARVAVLPVPYEGTVSYGAGASRGPAAILAASDQLEMYDEELDARIDQVGWVTLPSALPPPPSSPEAAPGAARDTEPDRAPELRPDITPERALEVIHAAALPPLKRGQWLLTLGGEHSVSVGVWRALLETRGGRPFSILQIDAHADLRQSYGGTPFSHACVMARAHDLGLPFVQVGVRAVCAEERAFLRETGLEDNVFWDHLLAVTHRDKWMDEAVARLGEEVYVTFDLDGLDPAIMPATGTPVPGGLSWHTATRLLRKLGATRRVIGADITELAPIPGLHAPDFLAARLAQKLIGYSLLPDPR